MDATVEECRQGLNAAHVLECAGLGWIECRGAAADLGVNRYVASPWTYSVDEIIRVCRHDACVCQENQFRGGRRACVS